MSYRYNTIDIIVGIGLCAILFGALLVFAAGQWHLFRQSSHRLSRRNSQRPVISA